MRKFITKATLIKVRKVVAVGTPCAFIASLLVMNAGCEAPILHPATGPGTDYPCGIQGLSCDGHMCCWQGDICGSAAAGSSCPANYCCFVGDEDSVGAKPNRKMITEQEMISFNK